MTSDLQESYKPAAKKTYCLTISNVLEVKSEERRVKNSIVLVGASMAFEFFVLHFSFFT